MGVKRINMERCSSFQCLPQDVKNPVKINLVKSSNSDGEEIMVSSDNVQPLFDNGQRIKKLKLNSNEFSQLIRQADLLVAPSRQDKKSEIVSSQDDLWSSIQSNYAYLMADDLITECQETKKELYLPLPKIPQTHDETCTKISQQIPSFDEFVEKFNRLNDIIHSLITATDTSHFKETRLAQLISKCQRLKEDGAILMLIDPYLKEDVCKRCNILANKLDILKDIVCPKRKNERNALIKSLSSQMKDLRQWLKEVEGKLRNLNLTRDCATESMNKMYSEEKVLQREIESRGKELTSLVRQCSSIEGASAAELKRLRQQAAHLERSWHNIWIRSLEKQCITEERLQQRQADENKKHDASDLEIDEGPVSKHRRLSLDLWKPVSSSSMDKLKGEDRRLNMKLATKDVGVACKDVVPVNDKCIMVGSTGIAALKATYGDDFTNFEIIQDVGYSSESSTHLSSDDSGGGFGARHFNIRVYNYEHDSSKNYLSLKEEFELFNSMQPNSVASSLGSSSFVDSGVGSSSSADKEAAGSSSKDEDFLDRVLKKSSMDFSENATLDFELSGLESDDLKEDFHVRNSFTKSAQVFYKMISVDSDNGELNANESYISEFENETTLQLETHTELFTNSLTESFIEDNSPIQRKSISSDSSASPALSTKLNQRSFFSNQLISSTPNQPYLDDCYHTPNLKRKRDGDITKITIPLKGPSQTSGRIRPWLKRCSTNNECSNPRTRRSLFRGNYRYDTKNASSCDASSECTSSSADEAPLTSDDVVSRLDSCSMEGSFETVVRRTKKEDSTLLPPPFERVPSCLKSGKCKIGARSCFKNCGYPLGSKSCGDIRWPNSFSIGHAKSKSEETQDYLSRNISKHRHRLSSSLPNFLPYHSDSSMEDAKNSSDSKVNRLSTSHCESLTSVFSRNLSGSSQDMERKKKRRSRKKSSNSNRSSRSTLDNGDCCLHHSRSSTASTCGSRRRHFSQRVDSFEGSQNNLHSDDIKSSEAKAIPQDDNVICRSLNDVFDLALEEEFRSRENSLNLLSTDVVDSDVVLTQLEEQSTVSDQVWDGYQDMPYLSEAYSEATVDEDAIRKLTDFGDDYCSAIGNPVAESGSSKPDIPKSPKKLYKSKRSTFDNDSDSDSEDLHHLIAEAERALYVTQATLTWRESDEILVSSEYECLNLKMSNKIETRELTYCLKIFRKSVLKIELQYIPAELLATCGAYLHYLESVKEHIEVDGKGNNFCCNDLKKLHVLIGEWKFLKQTAEISKEKYLIAKRHIDALFMKMNEITPIYVEKQHIHSWEDIEKKIVQLQTILATLKETKEELLEAKSEVQRFTTQFDNEAACKNFTLMDSIDELYRRWDDVYEKSSTKLTEFEELDNSWKLFNQKLKSLQSQVPKRKPLSKETCDIICANSSFLREDFDDLKKDLEYFKSCLNEKAWEVIHSNLNELELNFADISSNSTKTCSVDHLPSSLAEDDIDDKFEVPMLRLEKKPTDSTDHSEQISQKEDPLAKRKSSRFWRIFRLAVPVQLTLVLLFCLAFYFEPKCCDRLNNFTSSFYPQLRYFEGPPPV